MAKRNNVEEVWKNQDGKFFGMQSGTPYEKSEVEKIGNFYWTHCPYESEDKE